MGSDLHQSYISLYHNYFNPRSPHGERHTSEYSTPLVPLFQSTLPAWGATAYLLCAGRRPRFQSTLPAWGATSLADVAARIHQFQSTLPAWGATTDSSCSFASLIHFNPRSPHGERRDAE